MLLEDQPFVPKYFGHDVQLNKPGRPQLRRQHAGRAPPEQRRDALEPGVLLIDTRPAAQFRAGHLPGALNLQDGGKFETWLGSVVGPNEPFYLLADSQIALDTVIRKTAKIGYEGNIKGALLAPADLPATAPPWTWRPCASTPSSSPSWTSATAPRPKRRCLKTPCSSRCPSCASAPTKSRPISPC